MEPALQRARTVVSFRRLDLVLTASLLSAALSIAACSELEEDDDEQEAILTEGDHQDDGEDGWGRSDCFACHPADECEGAGPGLREPDCAACHGSNGARDYFHYAELDCSLGGCHEASHADQGFEAPDDCASCHDQGGTAPAP